MVTLYAIHGSDGLAASVETIAVTADGRRALIGSWTEYAEVIDVDAGKKWARTRPAQWLARRQAQCGDDARRPPRSGRNLVR